MSQTLSKEIMNRINKLDTDPILNTQEISIITPPPLPVEEKEKQMLPSNITSDVNDESNQYESISSKTTTLKPESIESMHQSSASETETGSSDVSNKTVIYRGPSKDVKQKVEYFESVKNVADQTKTVYHARESSDEKKI